MRRGAAGGRRHGALHRRCRKEVTDGWMTSSFARESCSAPRTPVTGGCSAASCGPSTAFCKPSRCSAKVVAGLGDCPCVRCGSPAGQDAELGCQLVTRRCRMAARTDNNQQRSRPEGGHGPSTSDAAQKPGQTPRLAWSFGARRSLWADALGAHRQKA